MEGYKEIFESHAVVFRKDYRGFILVVYKDGDGKWCGRAWRGSDWKPFFFDVTLPGSDDVVSFYREKIDLAVELVKI